MANSSPSTRDSGLEADVVDADADTDASGFCGDVFGLISSDDVDARDALDDGVEADDGLGVTEVVSSDTASSGLRNCCLSELNALIVSVVVKKVSFGL